MFFLTKNFYFIFNYLYLCIIKGTTRCKVDFKFVKIGRGLNIYLQHGAALSMNNLSARNNIKIYISHGRMGFGENCFVNNDCSFNCLENITVGEGTIIGESVKIYDHDHFITDEYNVSKTEFITSPVIIGANCWIGSNTIILKGVCITDNVIIGAGSLVNKSILESGVYANKNGSFVKIK